MPQPGVEIQGPGVVLRIVRNDGDLLEMEASYEGAGLMPPEHVHPRQAERFEILEGEVRAFVDGVERTFKAGQAFEVPTATPHRMAATTPTRMRWQVRPALRTAEFFRRLYGGDAGPDLLAEFSDEIRLTGG